MTTVDQLPPGTRLYTWINYAYRAQRADGDYGRLFVARADRDAALERLRNHAMDEGLSREAAFAGIVATAIRADDAAAHEELGQRREVYESADADEEAA